MKNRLNWKRIRKIFFKLLLVLLFVVTLLLIAGNIWVIRSTESYVFSDQQKIPANDVAMVLGTSKYSRSGRANLFFKSRIAAAVKLYGVCKVRHFLLSGDNSLSYYNEPQDMKKALIGYGIPEEDITLDYAGFRTFDSVVRSKLVFKQKKLTIITQEFHCYRALFISHYYGIDAVAYVTDPVPAGYALLTHAREWFARCKAIVDLYVLHKQPRYLGDEIDITIID